MNGGDRLGALLTAKSFEDRLIVLLKFRGVFAIRQKQLKR